MSQKRGQGSAISFSCSLWHDRPGSLDGIQQVDGLRGPSCFPYMSDAWVGMDGILGSAETLALSSHMWLLQHRCTSLRVLDLIAAPVS